MSSAAPARTEGISATDLFRLRFVDDVALSPDGSRIVCTVTQPDGDENRNRASIWLIPTVDGDARQLTTGEKKDTNPAWSPDGTRIAFVSDRGKKGQIFVLDLASGGEARRLTTDDDHAASEPVWSPDGTQIAFLCKTPSLPEPEHNVEYKDETDKPRIITRAKYKYDGEGFFDHTRKQLFVVPADGGEARQLTHGTMGVGQIAWSPDGTRIAFTANRAENEDHERRLDVWTVAVASDTLTQVTPH
ncbi:MAG: LpqB family beta-propeller domain-containing protein, partial [Thermomicrobia bacterium]|nr:LpqB family beta-propeller domain-containing protein [Thermomicrobia bacterium]